MQPKIKVCCIQSREEARMAIGQGAAAVGLVGAMPSGPGPISDDQIAEIAASIPTGVLSVLLTSRQSVADIIEHQRITGVNAIQIVDSLEQGTHAELRAALPGITLIQVIHVRDQESVAEAERLAPQVDAILLDSGNPDRAVKELGGTGRVHDWALSRRIVERASAPVFLAGGLTPENVGSAIQQVRPYGLDLCSGLRSDGRLDGDKLARFFANARA